MSVLNGAKTRGLLKFISGSARRNHSQCNEVRQIAKSIMQRYYQALLPFLAMMGINGSACTADEDTKPKPMACIDAQNIAEYKVVSDELIRLIMDKGPDVFMRLKRHCPQLHFHKYVSYTPVNGRLCARFDDIFTRSGTPCRIESFSSAQDEDVTTNP
ncbi:MAG: hypothetical protein HWE25_15410 [Alphaproteobacteria bacterium]|nr:hypothetical protein [Alphaproteobacteria bacterium]